MNFSNFLKFWIFFSSFVLLFIAAIEVLAYVEIGRMPDDWRLLPSLTGLPNVFKPDPEFCCAKWTRFLFKVDAPIIVIAAILSPLMFISLLLKNAIPDKIQYSERVYWLSFFITGILIVVLYQRLLGLDSLFHCYMCWTTV